MFDMIYNNKTFYVNTQTIIVNIHVSDLPNECIGVTEVVDRFLTEKKIITKAML